MRPAEHQTQDYRDGFHDGVNAACDAFEKVSQRITEEFGTNSPAYAAVCDCWSAVVSRHSDALDPETRARVEAELAHMREWMERQG